VPRHTDHAARRKQLTDALMRLAATQGLGQVSVRHVANEAGVSTGMVQHYFRTKDEMMTFALEMVIDNIKTRASAEAVHYGPDASPPGTLVRALLTQILPLDHTRRLEGHVFLAFLAYAAVKPEITGPLRDSNEEMHAFIAEQIRSAQATNKTAIRIDPGHAATALLALIDGLSLRLLARRYPAQTALDALDAHLAALFGDAKADSRQA
jgi:AcrR family transcriptional regulator